MNLRRYLILGVGGVVLVALYLFLRDYFTVDKCLDAGGRWDYVNKRCEFR